MNKITFENLPSTKTPINAENLNLMQNNIESAINEKNIITAGLNSGVTIATLGSNIIPLNKKIAQVGTGFTLKDGKIYVGSGINYVLVSGNGMMNIQPATNAAKNFSILKNGSEIALSMNSLTTTVSMNISRAIESKLVPVSEGDYFEYSVYAGVGDFVSNNEARSYITIQSI